MTAANDYQRDAAVLALVIALVLSVIFAPYLFGNYSLLSSASDAPSIYPTGAAPDVHAQRYHTLDAGAPAFQSEPWLAVEHRIVWEEHRLPFWDPYAGYGVPFDGAMQPQPFYPLTALLAVNPTPRAYNWFVVFRLFLAGWFAALFVRLFTNRYAAAVTGLGTALTGYYLLYNNVPHLSVDIGLPALLWATELVVRRPNGPRCAALALASGLTYLGGMPESALLSLSVAALYAVLRVASVPTGRVRATLALIASHSCGMLVGAIAIVPFVEYVSRSYNQHDPRTLGGGIPGLSADGGWSFGVITEIAPLVFGLPWRSIVAGVAPTGVRGFFGCTLLVLAVVALIAAVRRRDQRTPIVLFFGAIALYCVLKRYGNPLVNWTGGLPLFQLIQFPKYAEFCLGDSVAILAGFGAAALWEGRARARIVTAAFASVLALVTYLDLQTQHAIGPGPEAWRDPAAMLIAVTALVCASGLAFAIVASEGTRRRIASAGLAFLVVAELSAAYAVPQLWDDMPPISNDPYAGAPYLSYLGDHVDRSRERVFGLSGMLYPEWAGAYGFADPSAINALYPQEFLPFVNALTANEGPVPGDQADRVTGGRPLHLAARLVRRWMTLSSIAWLISPAQIDSIQRPPGGFLESLWEQTAPLVPRNNSGSVRLASARLNGVSEDVLFEHAPYAGARYSALISGARPVFAADIALDPGSYVDMPICGGPVTFTVDLEQSGRSVLSTSRTIDPKHVLTQRRWIPFRIDLSAFTGRDVTLRFITAADDACAAWAIWGEPRFQRREDWGTLQATHRIFEPAFHSRGAFVYRVPGVLPRISLFHRTVTANTDESARSMLANPGFDAVHIAVVDRAVPVGAQRGPESVTVTNSRSDSVTADVVASAPALLLQNDTDYPGWVARVDGQVVPIIHTDALFRGISVAAGRHVVTISYESRAALIGTIASVAGLIVLLCMVLAAPTLKRLRRSRKPSPA